MLDRITVHGARQHNLKNIDVEIPRNSLTVITGLSGSRKIVAGLRHHLRRGPAPLRRDALHLRAPVPRPDGAARRGFHRRPEPGHFHRAENHQPQPALHRRHHHRNLRLPAAALLLDRRAALPDLRQRDFAPDHRADSAARAGAASRKTASWCWRPWCAAARASTRRTSKSWRARASCGRASMACCARSTTRSALDKRRNHTIEVVVDRLLVKPGIEKRLEASIETATKLANGLVLIAVVNGEERLYSQKAGLHRMRRQHSATRAALVLLQQPLRRLRGVPRAGQPLDLRPRQGDRRRLQASARWRARPRRRFLDHAAANSEAAGAARRHRSENALREPARNRRARSC